jgi:hypothetical protein
VVGFEDEMKVANQSCSHLKVAESCKVAKPYKCLKTMKVLAALKLQTKVALQPVPFRGPNCNFPHEYPPSVSSERQRDETLETLSVTTAAAALRIPMIDSVSKRDRRAIVAPHSNAWFPSAKQKQSLYQRKIRLVFENIESPGHLACPGWMFAIQGFLRGMNAQ